MLRHNSIEISQISIFRQKKERPAIPLTALLRSLRTYLLRKLDTLFLRELSYPFNDLPRRARFAHQSASHFTDCRLRTSNCRSNFCLG